MPVSYFLVLSSLLFSIGVYGVLARENAVLVLLSIESLVAWPRVLRRLWPHASPVPVGRAADRAV